MNIYGISDIHLSGNPPKKPMTKFGPQYEGHIAKLEEGFKSIHKDSIVLVCGDITWAMNREEAMEDLQWLNSFGVKILFSRGNHDYFWGKKPASYMSNWVMDNGLTNLYFVDHREPFFIRDRDSHGITVTATRGCEQIDQYELPINASEKVTQIKPALWEKYKKRLEEALSFKPDILMSHIPPFCFDGKDNEYTEMVRQSGVSMVVFGHYHESPPMKYDEGEVDGILWKNLLCERMDFKPYFLGYVNGGGIPIFMPKITVGSIVR